MKKILLSVTAFLSFQFAMAQAPQGLNYQAVVFSSNGTALSNQLVSLRLSVLDSSATGTAVYVETQNPTTDTTGLFSVVIGNGTVVSGTFSAINWGKNYKFLKTEIDTLGGSNYVTMGVTQFMSVPYALYTNPTYESLEYPDGLRNITPITIDSTPYIVPLGKNLYIPPGRWYGIVVNSDTITQFGTTTAPYYPTGISSNEVVSVIYTGTFQGWLVDKTVNWITVNISSSPFIIPAGKIFIVTNSAPTIGSNSQYYLNLNGVQVGGIQGFPSITGTILSSGQVLSATLIWGSGSYIVNGYFRDE